MSNSQLPFSESHFGAPAKVHLIASLCEIEDVAEVAEASAIADSQPPTGPNSNFRTLSRMICKQCRRRYFRLADFPR